MGRGRIGQRWIAATCGADKDKTSLASRRSESLDQWHSRGPDGPAMVVVLAGGARAGETAPSGPPTPFDHDVGLEMPMSRMSFALGRLVLSALSLPLGAPPLGSPASVVGGLLLIPPPNLGRDPPLALPRLPSALRKPPATPPLPDLTLADEAEERMPMPTAS